MRVRAPGLIFQVGMVAMLSVAPLRSQSPPVPANGDAAVREMPDMPSGYFRGEVVGFSGTYSAGTLTAKQTTGEVYECAYDAKSLFQLRGQRVKVTELIPGDPIRVLVDHRPGSRSACYVRILDVTALTEEKPKSLAPTRNTQSVPPISDGIGPVLATSPLRGSRAQERGSEALAGVVVRLNGTQLTLRTRDGDREFHLRRDTKYVADGLKAEESALALNQRVSVRAGKNVEGVWEAYQVSWGGISATH